MTIEITIEEFELLCYALGLATGETIKFECPEAQQKFIDLYSKLQMVHRTKSIPNVIGIERQNHGQNNS